MSASLSDTNEAYFFGIANSSTPTVSEFHVSYGNVNGYGPKKIVSKDIGYVSSVHWYRRPYKRVKRLR